MKILTPDEFSSIIGADENGYTSLERMQSAYTTLYTRYQELQYTVDILLANSIDMGERTYVNNCDIEALKKIALRGDEK